MLYDTHAHLDFPDFASDLSAVLERAAAAEVSRIITVGTNQSSSRRAVELAETHPAVYAAIGWHPTHVSEAPDDIRPWLYELAGHPRVVALGETGLDYHRLPGVTDGSVPDAQGLKDKQRRLFEQHLETAAAHGLNCIIHQRDALADTLAVMERFRGRVRGQFHCFVDDVLALRRVLALGSIVSFTGILTFKNAEGVRRTLVSATLEDFLLETDCPFLAPVPHRGRRAEPAHLALIAAAAGQVKGVPLATLAEATCATAHRFFPKLGH